MTLNEELQKLRTDHRNVAIPYLVFLFILLGGLFWCIRTMPHIHLLWILPLLGVVQYYVVISGHEAVHKTLCFPLQINDFFGVMGQAMVGVNFTAYRQQHMDHHSCRDHTKDPDAHIYHSVATTSPGLNRTLVLLLGTFIEILVKIHQKGTGGFGSIRKLSPAVRRNMKRDSVLVIFTQLSLMGLSFFLLGPAPFFPVEGLESDMTEWLGVGVGMVYGYAVVWILPLFGVAVFLNRCRIVIEHGVPLLMAQAQDTPFGGPRIPTVDILPGPIQRRIFAPFSFNYHCAHHLFMAVPHYNLPQLHALLQRHNFEGHRTVSGGYLRALRDFLRA